MTDDSTSIPGAPNPTGAPADPPAEETAPGRLGFVRSVVHAGWSNDRLDSWRGLAALVAAEVVLGIVVGVIWRWWSPRTVSYFVDNGGGHGIVIPDESKSQMAGDGRFLVLSLIAAVLVTGFWWSFRASRGSLGIVLLAVGGIVQALVARTTGELLATGQTASKLNTAFRPELQLHSTSMLFIGAFAAVLIYTVITLLTSDEELRAGRSREALPPTVAPRAPEPGQLGV